MANNKQPLRRTEKRKASKNHSTNRDLQNGFMFGMGRELAISFYELLTNFFENT